MEAKSDKSNAARSANGKMTVRFEKIGPKRAQEILDTFNHLNRKISWSKVSYYADLMARGKYKCSPDAIAISDENPFLKKPRLINCQHRLLGVVQSGTIQEFIIVEGMADDTFEIIDTGKNRTAGDVLSTFNITNPSQIAAMAKFILRFLDGNIGDAIHRSSAGKQTISNSMVTEFVLKHHVSLVNSREFGYSKLNKLVTKPSLASLHFIFKTIHKGKADGFITQLIEGAELKKTSPVFLLRQMLDDNKSRIINNLSDYDIQALIIKAWNADFDGVVVEKLKFSRTSDNFPEIRGLKERSTKKI